MVQLKEIVINDFNFRSDNPIFRKPVHAEADTIPEAGAKPKQDFEPETSDLQQHAL